MKIRGLFFFFLFSLVIFVYGSPAYRVPLKVMQPDGTVLQIVRSGDEHYSFRTTLDNIPVIQDSLGCYYYARMNTYGTLVSTGVIAHDLAGRTDSENKLLASLPEWGSDNVYNVSTIRSRSLGPQNQPVINSFGFVRIPVILVEFTDKKFSMNTPSVFYENHFNALDYKGEGGAGSVRDYFIAQSYGLFQPQFDVIGPVQVSQSMSYYGANLFGYTDTRADDLIKEAISEAKKKGTDFSPYVVNGEIACVTVVFAGAGENTSFDSYTLWPQTRFLTNLNIAGSEIIKNYMYTSELLDLSGGKFQTDGIGVYCHEFSHLLGLPDFYATNNLTGVYGMDYWSLMDYGAYYNGGRSPVGYTSYEREFMGWMKVDTLFSQKQVVSIPPIDSPQRKAYRILNDADQTKSEYYLLECRQPSVWHPEEFGRGMLVLHVDYGETFWNLNIVNNNITHPRMTIIPSDDKLTISTKSSAACLGDLFPGEQNNTSLTDESTPSASVYTGGYMKKPINRIQLGQDGSVNFVYMAEGILDIPDNVKIEEADGSDWVVTWSAVENATSYEITLSSQSGLILREVTSKQNYSFKNLSPAMNYVVSVKALADMYIDSEPTGRTFTTGSLSDIRDIADSYSDEWIDIYNTMGEKVLRVQGSALPSLKLPHAIYICKSRKGNWKLKW